MKRRYSFLVISFLVGTLVLTSCKSAVPLPTTAGVKTTAAATTTTTTATTTTKSATAVASTTPAAQAPTGTLTVVAQDLGQEGWLPHTTAQSSAEWFYQGAVYELLLNTNDKGQLEPRLAERWTVSNDGLTWTFYLRKGIKFHNGDELTAEDVKYSYGLVSTPGSQSTYTGMMKDEIQSIDVVDPYQVVFRLKTVSTLFPQSLAQYPLFGVITVDKKYAGSVGLDRANNNPIGTGSWKFVEQVKGDHITMEAVTNHWRKTPAFKTLVIRKVPEAFTRVAMLGTGQADIATIGPNDVDGVKKGGGWILTVPGGLMTDIHLGGIWYRNPPAPGYDPTVPWALPDKAKALMVRQALNMAVDKQEIVKSLYQGYGRVTSGVGYAYYVGQPWTDPSWKPLPYDPVKAKQLLADAGYPKGFKVPMTIVPRAGREVADAVGEAVAQYWEKNLGLTVVRETMATASWRPLTRDYKWAGRAWAYATPNNGEPIFSLGIVGHSRGASGSYLGDDAKSDALVWAAMAEANPDKRLEIQKQIGQYLYDNQWIVPIAESDILYGMGPKIKALPQIPGFTYFHNLEYTVPK